MTNWRPKPSLDVACVIDLHQVKICLAKKGLTLIKSGKDPECVSYQAERKDALEDVKQACSVIEHSNVNHIR